MLVGDILQVCQDRRHVSCMYSYPNYIPLAADAVRRAVDYYERLAETMRNVVEGYGDRYMVSGASLLDEWAEEYGFDEVGRKLALARQRVKRRGRSGARPCG